MEKTIVILANSVKHKNHCVAGKCVETKEWIRPVADKNGKELSHEQAKYKNKYGTYSVKPLQKIKMSLQSKVSLINQPENYLIDTKIWEQSFSIDRKDLDIYLDKPANLWGTENRIDFDKIEKKEIIIQQSLYLIKIEELKLQKIQDPFDSDKYKRKGKFNYNKIEYELPVTDPNFDNLIGDKNEIILKDKYLCISLGEKFYGFCYKLVATII